VRAGGVVIDQLAHIGGRARPVIAEKQSAIAAAGTVVPSVRGGRPVASGLENR
jgi:hypothetical protein